MTFDVAELPRLRPEKAVLNQLIAGLGWQELPILVFVLVLVFVFFVVIRQNRKDLEEIEAWLAKEKLNF